MFKKNDRVEVINYAQPRRAQIIRRCPRAPRKWVVRFEDTNFVQTVKEEYIRKVR